MSSTDPPPSGSRKAKKAPRRKCETCRRKLPADAHKLRRFCDVCRKQRKLKPPKSRRTGRPCLITDERVSRIIQATRLGAIRKDAANYAGISDAALGEWQDKGRKALVAKGVNPDEPPEDCERGFTGEQLLFVRLAVGMTRARAEDRVEDLAIIKKAARGGAVWEPDPNHVPGPGEKQRMVQVGYREADWKAAQAKLAMGDAAYAKRSKFNHEVSGPGGAPMQVAHGVVIELPPEDDGPGEETSE